ncbi:9710_t:CDS:2 [Entrophospora sp. SA101]|nr:9710_t:CDS:2 [Entrophospora sp. SA101]
MKAENNIKLKLELIESYRQSIDIPKEVDELKNREELFDDSTMWHIGSLKFKIMDDEMSELHDKINALKKSKSRKTISWIGSAI